VELKVELKARPPPRSIVLSAAPRRRGERRRRREKARKSRETRRVKSSWQKRTKRAAVTRRVLNAVIMGFSLQDLYGGANRAENCDTVSARRVLAASVRKTGEPGRIIKWKRDAALV